MKFFNLEATTAENGDKVLNVTLYGDIDMGFFSDGVASAEIARMLADHADAKKITQRINSRGGDMFGGIAIYNALQNHGAEVVSIVEGQAGSAASIAAMAGRTVMQRGSMLMIHNPSAPVFGDAGDHRAIAEVLDKARDGLVAIYRAKTGKTAGELKKMLDAETWLTAEEAKREGFADEIADKPVKVRAEGETIIVNGVSFPLAGTPSPILAMAATPPLVVENVAPHDPPAAKMTLEQLEALAPELVNSIRSAARESGVKEGHAAGVAAERARLQAIDDLGLRGCDDLVAAAKYGEQPTDAPTLAVAVVMAGKQAGLELLEARKRESTEAAGVKSTPPAKNSEERDNAVIRNMADIAKAKYGGGSR